MFKKLLSWMFPAQEDEVAFTEVVQHDFADPTKGHDISLVQSEDDETLFSGVAVTDTEICRDDILFADIGDDHYTFMVENVEMVGPDVYSLILAVIDIC